MFQLYLHIFVCFWCKIIICKASKAVRQLWWKKGAILLWNVVEQEYKVTFKEKYKSECKCYITHCVFVRLDDLCVYWSSGRDSPLCVCLCAHARVFGISPGWRHTVTPLHRALPQSSSSTEPDRETEPQSTAVHLNTSSNTIGESEVETFGSGSVLQQPNPVESLEQRHVPARRRR